MIKKLDNVPGLRIWRRPIINLVDMEAFQNGKKRESLIVAGKVKAYIKSKKMMTSSDSIEALSEKVYALLDAAAARTKANRRSTVKPQDL